MSVSIVVPFRDEGGERTRNWEWLRARYERLYPNWEIVEGTCEGPWSKGAAVNSAAERASGDVLVVIDADVAMVPDALPEAVDRLSGAPWVIPHLLVYRLSRAATEAVFTERLLLAQTRRRHLIRQPFKGPNGGGASVMRRKDFVGIDEGFTDWGGEDISFARAMDTLIGEHLRLAHCLWHLHHEPMPRRADNRASPENEKLAAQYLDAAGDPVEMAKLCERRPYDGIMGGGVVVAPREAVREVPLDERFTGWGQEDESWAIALHCLLGAPYRGDADLVHLHHPRQANQPANGGRYGSPQSKALRCRYQFARNKPDLMRALIDEVSRADQPTVLDRL